MQCTYHQPHTHMQYHSMHSWLHLFTLRDHLFTLLDSTSSPSLTPPLHPPWFHLFLPPPPCIALHVPLTPHTRLNQTLRHIIHFHHITHLLCYRQESWPRLLHSQLFSYSFLQLLTALNVSSEYTHDVIQAHAHGCCVVQCRLGVWYMCTCMYLWTPPF